MRLQITTATVGKTTVGIALVERSYIGPAGDEVIRRLQPFFQLVPIMLVSINDNGFSAHAHFRTGQHLALLQLSDLSFSTVDLDYPPVRSEILLPF